MRIFIHITAKLLLISCLFLASNSWGQSRIAIQTAKKGGGNALEKKATRALRDEFESRKTTVKNAYRTKSDEYKKLPSFKKEDFEREYDPTLEELIEDENAKREIENPNNKERFIDLLTQWWMTPSDADLAAKLKFERQRDSISAIDSSEFRVPKLVKGTASQFVTVFGWHAHFNGNAYKTYDYGLLSAIAYYGYDIDPYTGEALDSTVIHDFLGGDDPDNGIVPTAHAKDCKVLLSITSHSYDNNAFFLAPENAKQRQNLIDNIVYLMDTSKADGVEINFENVPALAQIEFMKFVRQLSFTLRAVSPDLAVCMSVPAVDIEGVFNLGKMKEHVDFFIIKAVDYHNDPKTGEIIKKPGAPLNFTAASGEEDIRSSVEHYIASIGRDAANRLILALPNYGTLWKSSNRGFDLEGYVPYSKIQNDFVMRDSTAVGIDSNYYSYVWAKEDTIFKKVGGALQIDDIERTELYYDDVRTLRLKYQFINDMGLAGVGVWPLGYDLGYYNVWNTLSSEFTTIEMPKLESYEKLGAASKAARSWGATLLAVLLFWAIFASAGFCMALFNKQVRRALFANGRFRMIYLGWFSALLLMVGSYYGLFRGGASILLLGLVIGGFFTYGVIYLVDKQQAKAP